MNVEVKRMLELIFAANQSFLVLCAVKLDIVEHLSESPKDAKQLALATNTQPHLLHRFLRSLCSLNILEENKNGQFCVTKLGSTLKSGTQNCLKNYLKVILDHNPQPMMFLDHTLHTGETAFDSIFKMSYFEYISKNKESAKVFDDAMTEQAISFKSNAFLSDYDYSVFNHIIDVGGGKGHSLLSILHKTPNVRGTIFELEACIEKANEEIKLNGLEKRCVTVTGNFFDFVPEGGDCYILQNILHDWNDSKAMKILVNTRKAMKSDSKMIIIEEMIPDNDEHHVNTQFDVLMLAYFGGQTRSKRQIEEMCLQAKLKLHKYLKMKESAVYLMEFTPIN